MSARCAGHVVERFGNRTVVRRCRRRVPRDGDLCWQHHAAEYEPRGDA